MKNSAGQGGCDPPRPKAEVDNTLLDLQNSSYPTKAELNNCFIIHSKYSPFLMEFRRFILCFSAHQNHNFVPRFFRSRFNNLQQAALLTSLVQ